MANLLFAQATGQLPRLPHLGVAREAGGEGEAKFVGALQGRLRHVVSSHGATVSPLLPSILHPRLAAD